jgi:ribonuclease D
MDETPLVRDSDHLADLCDELRHAEWIAFDTEFIPEFTYLPVLCLVQVASDRHLFAIDPLEEVDLAPFWDLLVEPGGPEVIVHAGKEEFSFCLNATGRLPLRAFDVQLAAGLAGLGWPLSLTNLVQKTTRIAVRGQETRTDWRRRPLSERQIEYALDDVRHLGRVHRRLRSELERTGRDGWLEDEQRAAFDQLRHADSPDRFRRTPGSANLNPRALAVLRELYRWREAKARSLDRPARRVLRDDVMVDMAKRQPSAEADLLRTRGLLDGAGRKAAGEILDAIHRGLDLDEADLPARPPKKDHPDEPMVTKVLSAALFELATRHRVSAGLAGSMDDLREFTDWHRDGCSDRHRPKLARGWRGDLFGPMLIRVLDGQVGFRIARHGESYEVHFADEGDD